MFLNIRAFCRHYGRLRWVSNDAFAWKHPRAPIAERSAATAELTRDDLRFQSFAFD
jgi:hypothetical protein